MRVNNSERNVTMYLGVDIGGTNIAVGLVDEGGNIIKKDSVPTGNERPFEEIMGDIVALCKKVVADSGFLEADIKSVGIGVPGIPDPVGKRLVYANNLKNCNNKEMGKEINKYFTNASVHIENDANAAAYGEIIAGAAKGLKNVVVVTIGTGVGGGIIVDNKILSGFNFAGGEIGHTVIVKDGAKCNCGRRGCFEAYASATGLIRQTKEIITKYPDSIIHTMTQNNPDKIDGKTAFDAAKKGDEAGKKIVSQFIEYLGIGITDIVNIFQPEAVVIGGGLSKEGDYLLEPLRAYVKDNSYEPDGVESTKIVAAKLGNDAGIIGAALLYRQIKS